MSPGVPSAATGRRSVLAHTVLMAAMMVWGINLSAVKALTEALDVLVVASVRMVVAAAALIILLAPRWRRLTRIRARAWPGLVACALLMVYANQIFFASGLSRTTATNAALVMACSPLVASLIATLTLGDRLGWRRVVGILLGFAGVAAVILDRPDAALSRIHAGDLLLLGAVASFAAGGALVQRLSEGLDPLEISGVVHVISAALLSAHTLARDPAAVEAVLGAGAWHWGLILFSGVGATALVALAWNRAIASIGMARTSLALYWVPIYGLAFAALTLGERVTTTHLAGLVCVIVGLSMGQSPPVANHSSSSANPSNRTQPS